MRANKLAKYKEEENGDWKFLIWDELSDSPKMPGGTVGHRWGEAEGKWNLEFKDPSDDSEILPKLTLIDENKNTAQVITREFGTGKISKRGVPTRTNRN